MNVILFGIDMDFDPKHRFSDFFDSAKPVEPSFKFLDENDEPITKALNEKAKKISLYYQELHQARDSYRSPILSELSTLVWGKGHVERSAYPKTYSYLGSDDYRDSRNISTDLKSGVRMNAHDRNFEVHSLDEYISRIELNLETSNTRADIKDDLLDQYVSVRKDVKMPSLKAFIQKYNSLVDRAWLSSQHRLTSTDLLRANDDDKSYNDLFKKIDIAASSAPPDFLAEFVKYGVTLVEALKFSPAVKEVRAGDAQASDEELLEAVDLFKRRAKDSKKSLDKVYIALTNLTEAKPRYEFLVNHWYSVKPYTKEEHTKLSQMLKWAKKLAAGIDGEITKEGSTTVYQNKNSSLWLILEEFEDILKGSALKDKDGESSLIKKMISNRENIFASLLSNNDSNQKRNKNRKDALLALLSSVREFVIKTNYQNEAKAIKLMFLFTYLAQAKFGLVDTSDFMDPVKTALQLDSGSNSHPYLFDFFSK